MIWRTATLVSTSVQRGAYNLSFSIYEFKILIQKDIFHA